MRALDNLLGGVMIRVLLVDDHRLFRIALRRLLDASKGIQIVGEAETGEAAVAEARELRPNVVLMDICMPGIGGIEATRRITRMDLDIKVIAVTACEDTPFPVQALKAGASGYLTKSITADELSNAIRRVFLGKRGGRGSAAYGKLEHLPPAKGFIAPDHPSELSLNPTRAQNTARPQRTGARCPHQA